MVQLPGRWDAELRNMTMPQNAANFLGMSAQTTMTATTLDARRQTRTSHPLTPASRFHLSGRSRRLMANEHHTPAAPPAQVRTAASASAAGPEPHLFDRLSVLYKYRWAAVAVFMLVVGWVMVDSYTRIPVYRATARVLIEDPNADIATPTEIARNVTLADPEIYLQTQLRIMRGRDLAQRVAAKLDMQRVPEFNGQGPKPTQLARRHCAGEVLRAVAVPADHVDAGRRPPTHGRLTPCPSRAIPKRCWPGWT